MPSIQPSVSRPSEVRGRRVYFDDGTNLPIPEFVRWLEVAGGWNFRRKDKKGGWFFASREPRCFVEAAFHDLVTPR